MESVKDILFSIKDWFKDRIGNPFFAAFIFAWLVLNWRVALIVFDDLTAIEKIRMLDQKFFTGEWDWFIYSFWWPSILAMAYVIFSPPLFQLTSGYHRWQQHRSAKLILRVDKIEPLTQEQAQILRDDRLQARLELKDQIKKHQILQSEYLIEIDRLQKTLAESGVGAVHPISANEIAPSAPPVVQSEYQGKVKNIAAILSVSARSLLAEACNTENGLISVPSGQGDLTVIVGNHLVVDSTSPNRHQSAFRAALSELGQNSLMQVVANTDIAYKITQLGYDVNDSYQDE